MTESIVTGEAAPAEIADADEIKRTSGPQTADGKRWEAQLSGTPSREWRELFKTSGESTTTIVPRRLEFDRACVVFQSDEAHVKPWIESIDKWIVSTNTRLRISVEQVRRERSDRLDASARERERIRALNERFSDL